MGKKKATKSRKLRPILEAAIARGEIYCKGRGSRRHFDMMTGEDVTLNHDTYDICFGEDTTRWYDDSPAIRVIVKVFDDGEIEYHFFGNRNHMLDRTHSTWFKKELEEIITMHKLGAFESERAPLAHNTIDQIYSHYRSKKKKV